MSHLLPGCSHPFLLTPTGLLSLSANVFFFRQKGRSRRRIPRCRFSAGQCRSWPLHDGSALLFPNASTYVFGWTLQPFAIVLPPPRRIVIFCPSWSRYGIVFPSFWRFTTFCFFSRPQSEGDCFPLPTFPSPLCVLTPSLWLAGPMIRRLSASVDRHPPPSLRLFSSLTFSLFFLFSGDSRSRACRQWRSPER